jgi:saccharopine dehydrogenase-like NADP-dependent oxidoreductase
MPEAGLDPGIDLVLCGYGASQMDEVYELHSYCGGFPERTASDNPLNYKITWTWNGVLLSYKRPARIMRDGEIIDIPARDQHADQWIKTIDFPGVGQLELIPNGDAVSFADCLGLTRTLRSTTRCSMRWPGHAALWNTLVALKFLSDEPVKGLPFDLTPHEFMVKHLEPRLQYARGERDIVAMRNVIIGSRVGRQVKITYDMLDMRDVKTGLFAMNRTVGFAASIIAQMIAQGEIARKGLLATIRDVPYRRFIDELGRRGIAIRETVEPVG